MKNIDEIQTFLTQAIKLLDDIYESDQGNDLGYAHLITEDYLKLKELIESALCAER